MSRKAWIVLGALVVLLVLGGGVAYYTATREKMRELLRAAALRHGLPPTWLEAIGYVESGWNSAATNYTGGDLARGGAVGATQITIQTAKAHGFTGTAAELLGSPELQAEWTGRIAAAGKPLTIEDLGAWWNAGRRTASALPAGHVTLTTYIPRLRAALAKVA